jgi:hypothetical protein
MRRRPLRRIAEDGSIATCHVSALFRGRRVRRPPLDTATAFRLRLVAWHAKYGKAASVTPR